MKQRADESALNLPQIFFDRAASYRDRAALLYKDSTGRYLPISWAQWRAKVGLTARGLTALGMGSGARVGILSENRPEWTFADLGVLCAGAVTVPIYPTSSCSDIAYIANDAGINILFVSSSEQLFRIKETLRKETSVNCVIVFDSVEPSREEDFCVMTLESLHEKGRLQELNGESDLEKEAEKIPADQLATIIYTSGTTGPPKGVMLSHKNFVSNYIGASKVIQIKENDVALSFLPLSHVFERLAGYYFMVFHGACVAYAENMQTVPADMLQIRPTVAASVPRLYEKIYSKIMETIQAAPPLKKGIFNWALKVGRERLNPPEQKKSFLFPLKYRIAKALVFSKLQKSLGGRLRFFISGGAPLSKEIAEFFYCAGVLILEGYGLTETSPVIAVNSPAKFRFGTVGQVLPNVQVKIAEDGEILTAGPCVMKGYYKNEQATKECMKDGWFCTGDIGEFDADGYLSITDRKKDIIVTSGGKNISPQNIEGLLLRDPLFVQAVVIGDKKNYLTALIVPKREEIQKIADTLRVSGSWPELLKSRQVYEAVDERLKKAISGLSRYEQIKYFSLISEEFTLDKGDLTPTLKVKRRVIVKKYEKIIDELYSRGEAFKAGQGA